MAGKLRKIRNKMGSIAVDHLEKCRNGDYVRHLIFKLFPGAGKTATVMKAIDEYYFNWIYLCYSDDTEILTKNDGWILFEDLTKDHKVACLSQDDHTMYWHEPSAIQKYYYNDKMYRLKHRSLDLLVTPNHRLYLAESRERKGYHLKKIKNAYFTNHILDSFGWEGEEREWFYPPQIEQSRNKVCILREKIPMDLWLKFLGWYIAEGSTDYGKSEYNSYRISIAQTINSNYLEEIKEILNKLELSYGYYEQAGNFIFSNKQLAKYLSKIGVSYEKYIPQEFMNLSKRQLKILFDAMMKGDGDKNKKRYTTTSEKLADQLQEIAIKIGYNSTKSVEKRKSKKHHDIYRIYFRKKDHLQVFKNKNISEEWYSGYVYSCTVPEHIILVRRNGRVTFCGNSPFHDIVVDNVRFSDLRNYKFVHLKGRKQPGVCIVSKYRKLAKKGLNIDPFCRTRCKFKNNGCEYFETRKKIEDFPQPWAGVHSHIPTYLQSYLFQKKYQGKIMKNYYDAIIIDEFPFQVLYDQVICNRSDIDKLRDVINKIEKNTQTKEFINKFLNELTLATGSIDINYSMLISLINNYAGLDFDDFIERYDTTLLRIASNEKRWEPPKKIIYMIKQIYEEKPEKEKLRWNIKKHKWDGWNPSGIYLTTSNVDKFQNIGIPIIALDATAKKKAWDTLLGANCRLIDIDIEYQNLYQLNSNARYPARSWIDRNDNKFGLNDTGKRLAKLVKEICKRKKYNVLLCCSKKVQKVLSNYLHNNYDRNNYTFANYYNLRSRNSFYEECDTCIIIHEPNIPKLQMNIISKVVGWDNNLLRDLMTTSEVYQGIGRIRQNIKQTPHGRERKEIEIYVIPGANNSTNKVLNEAQLISYNDMKTGNLMTIEERIKEMIKNIGRTSFKSLYEVCNDFVTKKTLRNVLKKLYMNEFITNYKRTIEWDYEAEKERNKIKYKGKF